MGTVPTTSRGSLSCVQQLSPAPGGRAQRAGTPHAGEATPLQAWLRQRGLLQQFEAAKAAGDFASCAAFARAFRWGA